MNVDTVTDFHGDFAQIFMGPMHGVSQLQGGNVTPASFLEHLAGLLGTHVDAFVANGIFGFAQHLDRAGQVDRFLVHDHLDAGVVVLGNFPEILCCGGPFTHIAGFAFENLVCLGHLKFFGDLHGRHDFVPFGIIQGNLVADVEAIRIFLGSVHGDGNRPESTVRQQIIFADAFPVGLGHKTGQWAEPTDAHHDQITFYARGNLDFLETFRLFLFRLQRSAFKQAAGQTFSTMRGNQLCHCFFLLSLVYYLSANTEIPSNDNRRL